MSEEEAQALREANEALCFVIHARQCPVEEIHQHPLIKDQDHWDFKMEYLDLIEKKKAELATRLPHKVFYDKEKSRYKYRHDPK